MRKITKKFLDVTANNQISLSLKSGEILALLGENGAGKTTLMNVLFGYYQPDEGDILINGEKHVFSSPKDAINAGIAMIHQHFTLVPTQTVLENVMIGMEDGFFLNIPKAKSRLQTLQEQFGLFLDPDVSVKSLSIGEKQKLEILKALYRQANILIMDEPTAVLAPTETIELFKTLKVLVSKGKSIIFISHHLQEVMEISDRVIVLRNGKNVAERTTSSTSIPELANLMVGRELMEKYTFEKKPSDEKILEVGSLEIKDKLGAVVVDNVSLSVNKGEIVGIAGVSGNGQTELSEFIFGQLIPVHGNLRISGKTVVPGRPDKVIKTGMGRIPEDRISTGLLMDLSVKENLILEKHAEKPFSDKGMLNKKEIEKFALESVENFSVKTDGINVPVKTLSGGNLQKVILARELSGNPGVVVASQPTRGLDVGAMEFVHNQIIKERDKGAGVLLISDDLEEIFLLSDRILVMYKGKIIGETERDSADREQIGLWMSGVAS